MWVYVIGAKAEGPHKIGISRDPAERLKTLQAGSGDQLCVVRQWLIEAPRAVEMAAHRALDAVALGREWFAVTAEEAVATVERAMVAPPPPARKAKRKPAPLLPQRSLDELYAEAVAQHGEAAVLTEIDRVGASVAAWRAENDRKGLPPWP